MENSGNNIKKKGNWKTIFKHADAVDLWLMIFGGLGAIGEGISTALMYLVIGKIFNNLGNGISSISVFYHKINKDLVNLLYLACGSFIASFLEGYCWTRTGGRQAARTRASYLKALLRQDIEYFDLSKASTADVITSISSDSILIQDVLSEKVPNFILQCATFVSLYAAALIRVWRLASVAFPTIPLLIIPGIIYGRILTSLARKIRDDYSNAGAVVEQAVSSIRTVYSFVAESKTVSDFSTALAISLKLGIRQGLVKGIVIGSNSITYAIWALMAWYGSRLVVSHGVQGGTIVQAMHSILMGGIAFGSGLSNVKYFAEAATAGERIMDVINRMPRINSESPGEILDSVSGEVEFRGVGFAYPSRPGNQVLKDFNLKVPPRKTMALVGSSGCGKSTVISLLERFYDPTVGEIVLDGVDIRRLNLKWMRSLMGLVSQEPVLFASSIKDNIMFGKEDATMEEVLEAAKASNAHGFISRLPKGYDTQVGERGVQLSAGQKQRIAIARAIVKSPKILLLDEATSALDSKSEQIVQEALDIASVGRTTVVIAHRISTIRYADQIAVVQAGHIVEIGSHNDLIRNVNGLYASFTNPQSKIQEEEQNASSYSSKDADKNMARSDISRSSSNNTNPSTAVATIGGCEPGDELERRVSQPPFWRLLKLNAPEWKNVVLGIFCAIISGGINPSHAFFGGILISAYFLKDHNEITSKAERVSLIFLLISIVSFLTNIGQHFHFGVMGECLTKRVREKLLTTILTLEVGWFDQEANSTGAVCSRISNDAYAVRSLVADRIALLVQTFSSIVISFAMGLTIGWRLAIVVIAVQPLAIFCFYARIVLLRSMSSKAMKAQSESSNLAAETVSNIRTVTAFSFQDRILCLFELAQQGPYRESIRQSWLAGIVLGLSQSLIRCTIALSLWYGARLMIQGYLTAKAVFQIFIVLVSTSRVIAEMGSMTTDIAQGAKGIDSIFSILDRASQIEPDKINSFRPKQIIGSVEFQQVSFAYPARPDIMIFNGLFLTIEAGKSTALVGQSGSGKSTIIALIERFYDPLHGIVTIDGQDIKSYHLRSLRRQISLVGQEPTLFSGTVKENIVYGTEGATEVEIEDAARTANAHDFISHLSDGYNTWCGDRGVQLSGGQKQRIAIARAVLKNPAILLLDEATSALDGPSEKIVQEALERVMVNRTCVVVAHRLSTVQNCELIVVLEKGVVPLSLKRDLMDLITDWSISNAPRRI